MIAQIQHLILNTVNFWDGHVNIVIFIFNLRLLHISSKINLLKANK